MRGIIFKLIIIAFAVSLLFIPVNTLVRESYDYNIDNQILAFKNNPYPVDIINIGASHSMYGFYFKHTGLSHVDLALPLQTLEYDYKLLKEYGEHLKPAGVVLVSISQISFVNAVTEDIGNYYRILDRDDIEPLSLVDYYSYLHMPGTNSDRLIGAITEKVKEFRWPSHSPWRNDGINYAERKYKLIDSYDRAAKGNNSIEKNMEHLRNIVDWCKEAGYKVVFTMEPVHSSYNEYFTEEVLNRLVYQYLEEFGNEIPFLNYMDDARFVDQEEYFLDPDHLNSKGRKKYSRIVYEDLKRMGYM
ncbi:MAG: hypothetical protein ACRCWQ_15170 [Bacilli bacterium]